MLIIWNNNFFLNFIIFFIMTSIEVGKISSNQYTDNDDPTQILMNRSHVKYYSRQILMSERWWKWERWWKKKLNIDSKTFEINSVPFVERIKLRREVIERREWKEKKKIDSDVFIVIIFYSLLFYSYEAKIFKVKK